MSERYELVSPHDCPLDLLGPGEPLGVEQVGPDHFALVIGDPSKSALAVEGTQQQLRQFAQRVADVLDALPRDHAAPAPPRAGGRER